MLMLLPEGVPRAVLLCLLQAGHEVAGKEGCWCCVAVCLQACGGPRVVGCLAAAGARLGCGRG